MIDCLVKAHLSIVFYHLLHLWGCEVCFDFSSLKVVKFLIEGRETLELVDVWIFVDLTFVNLIP